MQTLRPTLVLQIVELDIKTISQRLWYCDSGLD